MAYISAGLIARDTVSDNASLALQGPLGVHSMTVGAQTFVFVASTQDDGVQGFNLHADGELVAASTTYDAAGLGLNGATNVAQIGNYLYVSGYEDSAITAFQVSAAGALTNGTTVAQIDGPGGRMSTFEAGGRSYLTVAGYDNGELKLFLADGTTLSSVQIISDQTNPQYRLYGATETATANVGGNTFVLVSSFEENAVSVFSLNSTLLSFVSNVEDSDSPSVELGGAIAMATGTVNGTTFVVVAAKSDNGLSVFSLSGAGLLTNVFNLEDSASIPMAGPNGITSFVIDGETFVAVTGSTEAGMTVFHLGAGGVLSYLTSFTDTAQTAVAGASSPAFANVGGHNLLVTAGVFDNGATSFDLGGANDALTGTAAADQMFGFAGNDVLSGKGGDDWMRGGSGNDTLNGGTGADRMEGGTGDDKYHVDNVDDRVVEAVSSGADTIYATTTYTLRPGQAIETIRPESLNGSETISLAGNEYSQTVQGNAGINKLFGYDGNDQLFGYAGADTLSGGLGADKLYGGVGNDVFVFDTALGAANIDTIVDFVSNSSGNNDTIRLENAIFKALTATGTLAAGLFAANATGVATQADDRIIYETDTGKLFYDSNGSGAGGSVQFATLTNHPTITASDFLVT